MMVMSMPSSIGMEHFNSTRLKILFALQTMTEAQIKKIQILREQGKSYREIAKKVGVRSPNTVAYFEKRYPSQKSLDVEKLRRDNQRLVEENVSLKWSIKKLERGINKIRNVIRHDILQEPKSRSTN
jgi:transcriptional regulator with XRE-family HTH domain